MLSKISKFVGLKPPLWWLTLGVGPGFDKPYPSPKKKKKKTQTTATCCHT